LSGRRPGHAGPCGKAARTARLALGRLPNRIKLYPRCMQQGRHLRVDAPKGVAVRAFRGEERTGDRGSATAVTEQGAFAFAVIIWPLANR
jgi:hypothetical protein